jgi:hypothetical protein
MEAPNREAPPLPPGSDHWPDHVKDWWTVIWQHPVAEEWDTTADAATVARLGSLYAANTKPNAAMLAQIAKLEGELLLTPASRKRAYVRLPDEESDRQSPASQIPERWRNLQVRDETDYRDLLRGP